MGSYMVLLMVQYIRFKEVTMEYVYTVWFRDLNAQEDDQDYEWPACFVIIGETELSCQRWGDHLAKEYAPRYNNHFMFSEIERAIILEDSVVKKLPRIHESEEASESKIGW